MTFLDDLLGSIRSPFRESSPSLVELCIHWTDNGNPYCCTTLVPYSCHLDSPSLRVTRVLQVLQFLQWYSTESGYG